MLDYPSPHFHNPQSDYGHYLQEMPEASLSKLGIILKSLVGESDSPTRRGFPGRRPCLHPLLQTVPPSNREDVYNNEKSKPQIVLWADHTLLSTGDWKHDKLDLQASQ